MIKKLFSIASLLFIPIFCLAQNQNETIIIIRHAEKTQPDNGNLDCQGLNRSLKLPPVIQKKFGQVDYIYVPRPSAKLLGERSYYVRPLATIEPTSVLYGLSVHVKYPYDEGRSVAEDLLNNTKFENKTILLAWEHYHIPDIIKGLGIPAKLTPPWNDEDFDTIAIVKIVQGQPTLRFDHEGLNDQPKTCHFT